MEWILVYKGQTYNVYRDKEGKLIKFVYPDGSEEISNFDWTHDDISQGG